MSGHASEPRKTERARYTEEYFVHVLKDGIDQLELPIDTDLLNQKWRELGRVAVPRTKELRQRTRRDRVA